MTTERWVIECDGWQDYLRIADRPHYNVEKAITVEAWVTYRKQWWGAGFVSRGTTAGFKLIQNGNSGFAWVFRPRGISSDHVNDTGPMLDEFDKPKFAMDAWHHVAATYDGRVARTYFDGVLVKETTIEAPGIEWQSGDLFIGWAPNNSASVGLDGRLAEVRVWKVARSEEEIRRDMQGSLTGKEPGLIGYWPLDEGSGTTIRDRTGYTNDGWLANGARWVKAALELAPAGAPTPPPAAAGPAMSAYAKAVLADGPIAYWKLDETSGDVAHDSSGNDHHGAVKGTVKWGQPGAGPALTSASFDGKTGYVEITDTKWGGGQELTVVAWAHLREVPSDVAAIFGALDQSFVHVQITAENFTPAVYVNSSDQGLYTNGRTAPAGKWCHLALVAANGDVRAYVDGKIVATSKPSFSSVRPTDKVRIGSGYGSGRFFPGRISDVAVFGRVLSTDRILEYIEAAKAPAQPSGGGGAGPELEKRISDLEDRLAKCGDCCSKIEALEKALGGARRKPYVLFFDGKDDEVSFPPMDLDFSKGATIEAWVRWTNFQRFARILELSTGSSQNSVYLLNGEANNNLLWGVNRPDLEKSTQAVGALETGKWMHLAATVDAAGNMAVYRDGKLVHTDRGKPPSAVVRTWNYISRSPWANDGRFHGQLTELRVWGVARTEAEIAAGMSKGLTGGEPNLQAYWPTNEGTGGILKDRTGKGHDGTILGATWQEVNDLPMEGAGAAQIGGGVDTRELAEIKDKLAKDLADLEQRLGKQLTDLDQRLAKCGDCCGKIAALETRVAGAEGKLIAHDKTFAGVDQRLAEQDQKIAGNAVKVAEQDQKIAALSGAIAMQDKKIATIDALDAEQEKKIAGAYAKVAEQDQKLVGLAEKNTQQDAQLAEHAKQIADLSSKAAKCQDCDGKLAVQQARIDDLVAQLGKHTGDADRLAVLEVRVDDLVAQLGKHARCDDRLAIQQARIDELSAKAAKCQDCEQTIAGLKKIIDEQETRIARLEGRKGPEIVQPPPVWPPPGAPARLVVSYIHFIGAEKVSQGDEYIEIKNVGGTAQSIAGWRVRAGSAGQDFVFPAATTLEPGARLRVYTNHKEPGSFSFGSKKALWNDAGDLGQLLDASGKVVSELGYGAKETRTLESIKATYGVEKMEIVFDPAQVKAQKRKSDKMDFLTAVERAIRSLLEDPADQDRPNAANQVRDNFDGVPKDADAALIQRYIRDHMNRNKLRLLSEDSPEKTDLDVSTRDAWVFLLDQGMGDLHRVVVHRQGAEAAYQEIT